MRAPGGTGATFPSRRGRARGRPLMVSSIPPWRRAPQRVLRGQIGQRGLARRFAFLYSLLFFFRASQSPAAAPHRGLPVSPSRGSAPGAANRCSPHPGSGAARCYRPALKASEDAPRFLARPARRAGERGTPLKGFRGSSAIRRVLCRAPKNGVFKQRSACYARVLSRLLKHLGG